MRCYTVLDLNKEEQRLFMTKVVKKFSTLNELGKISLIKPKILSSYKNLEYRISFKNYKKLSKVSGVKLYNTPFLKEGWNKRELNFLKINYMSLTARQIAIKLNKTIDSVKHTRRKLKLYKGPKYKWRKENVIKAFNGLKKKLGYTPSYEECRTYIPGALTAIHKMWEKYSSFLNELGLNIRIRYWTNKSCTEEFMKIANRLAKTPTQDDFRVCPGLFKAIIHRWKTYNKFLNEVGYKPNLEHKWNKDSCIKFFRKFMKNRKKIPTIEELYEVNPAFIAAVYKHCDTYNKFLKYNGYKLNFEFKWNKEKCETFFKELMIHKKLTPTISELRRINASFIYAVYRYYGSYYDFLNGLGYLRIPRDLWLKWEEFIIKVCDKIYGNIKIRPRLPNNKIPDVAIGNNLKYNMLIDAKMNASSYQIIHDSYNYSPYCRELEFWCCYGENSFKILDKMGVKIRNFQYIERLVRNLKDEGLAKELEAFRNVV